MVRRILLLLTLLGTSSLPAIPAGSQEPTWQGTIIARGEQRVQIQSTDIVRRPYRPLHFYGNTVRRRYYRGIALPLPRDVLQGLSVFLAR